MKRFWNLFILVCVAAPGASASAARPRIVLREADPGATPQPPVAAAGQRIIYMNRNGVTVTSGPDDSRANVSSIPDSTSTIPPFQRPDSIWNGLMECMRDVYAPFNITITDVDPGSTPHTECVVGGQPSDPGLSPDVGGIAPGVPDPCGVGILENAMTFVFDVWGPNVEELCWAAAQETAHAFGLEHEYLCTDPMTYLTNCSGRKYFQDQDADCGEFMPRTCRCNATQNSLRRLLQVLGPADQVPPTADITEPADGATVSLGFVVKVAATDNIGLQRAILWIDGVETDAYDAAFPFEIETPLDLPLGQHTIEVRVLDRASNEAVDSITVTVEPGCAVDSDCGEHMVCQSGACIGGLGATCVDHGDCQSGLCDISGEGICTQICSDSAPCPDGFSCQTPATGGVDKCYPSEGGDGICSVSVGASRRTPYYLAGLFAGLFLVVARRARRR